MCAPVSAETTELGDVALHQAIADLSCDASLMCVAAHPDDEDDATLALYRKKYGARTIAVIATRGEGGQNEIGPELYNDLGVIRTREMMRAAAVIGAELHFLNLPEAGYSKSSEETFALWGREETVRRLVRVIRLTQPTVIISNHGTQKDHGHHQAIGIALQEAFDAAGDATQFSDLAAEGLKPWQPSLLYLRAWQSTPNAVRININELDPVRGKTYAEIAADALAEHKSQGMKMFIDAYRDGRVQPAYTLVKNHSGSAAVSAPKNAVLFAPLSPAEAEPADWPIRPEVLSELARTPRPSSTADGAASAWLSSRRDRAVARAFQFRFDAEPGDTTVTAGQTVSIKTTLHDFAAKEATATEFALEPARWFPATVSEPAGADLGAVPNASAVLSLTVPAEAPVTVPEGPRLFDAHFMEPQLTAVARVTVAGAESPIELRLPITLKIAPRVVPTLLGTPVLLIAGHHTECTFKVHVRNYAAEAVSGTIALSATPGMTLELPALSYELPPDGEMIFPVRATVESAAAPATFTLRAVADADTNAGEGVARLIDLAVPDDRRVGIVQSYDDTLTTVLEKLGIPHEPLDIEDFTAETLDRFSTVIVDIRAYMVRDDLAAHNTALLDFVSRGGALLTMYQKADDWKPTYAPYPIMLSRNRVTREDAEVRILAPDHPVFTTPNTIAAEDWNGWVQERGLYFPVEWENVYTPLIACNDPGESIPPGALLFARHGDGAYVYTALALYRQLRELHPGALKLFVNLIALGPPRTDDRDPGN